MCPLCNKPFTERSPNWSLLDLIPESSYDILKQKLEQSLNDLKKKTDQLESEQFKSVETQILNHTNEIIKSVQLCQSNLLSELNSIRLERTKEHRSLEEVISKITDQLKNNDLSEVQLNLSIQKYSNLKPIESQLLFVTNNDSIHLDSSFIGKLVK